MGQETSFPDYLACLRLLEEAGSVCTPAECQGMITGLGCGDPKRASATLAAMILDELAFQHNPSAALETQLKRLCEDTWLLLREGDLEVFEYSLWLPPEEAPAALQLNALSEFCKGFLFGLGLSGLDTSLSQVPEVKEVLEDLSAIAKLKSVSDSFQMTDRDRQDKEAVEDYIRIAIPLLQVSLRTV